LTFTMPVLAKFAVGMIMLVIIGADPCSAQLVMPV